MKKILFLTSFLALPGCASSGDILQHQSASTQNYRLKGSDNPIRISGEIKTVATANDYGILSTQYKNILTVSINDTEAINGVLNGAIYTGELSGVWNGIPVSTDCNGKYITRNVIEVKCLVFIDNERTVTLTF